MTTPPIFVVSGGEGKSGEQVVQTALAQFAGADLPVIIVSHVREHSQLTRVVQEAEACRGTIVHTLVDLPLRRQLTALAHDYNVTAIDLMGSLLSRMAAVLGQEPLGQPGMYRQIRQTYFERIEAIEFTVAHDDGRNPDELDQAEIVLTGVSRVGKTPLAMYLSVQGWKTANVPLIPGIEPPQSLFSINPSRVVGLTIDPTQLLSHRRWRQPRLKISSDAEYVNLNAIYDAVEAAMRVFRKAGFAVVDITSRPIEETASEVIALVTRRQENPTNLPQ